VYGLDAGLQALGATPPGSPVAHDDFVIDPQSVLVAGGNTRTPNRATIAIVQSARMRFGAVVAIALPGCLPILSPPVHAKFGAAYTTTAVNAGTPDETHWPSFVAAGLDTANVTEALPFNVGAGMMYGFDNEGAYLEAGTIQRTLPHLRIGVTGGSEYWIDGHGLGLRAGMTVEYTGHDMGFVGSRVDMGTDGTHNKSTMYYAATGSFAVGGYIDVGHRWLRDEPNNTYVCIGISVRLAAIAGIVDLSESH
jgi:hypothetical protein